MHAVSRVRAAGASGQRAPDTVALRAFGTVLFGPDDCRPCAPGGRLFTGCGWLPCADGLAGD